MWVCLDEVKDCDLDIREFIRVTGGVGVEVSGYCSARGDVIGITLESVDDTTFSLFDILLHTV